MKTMQTLSAFFYSEVSFSKTLASIMLVLLHSSILFIINHSKNRIRDPGQL